MDKKKLLLILALSPLLPQRQGYYPHSVGVSQGATLFIVAQLHGGPAPHFLNFRGPLYLIFLLFILEKNISIKMM